MIVRHFKDLVCWQLSYELKCQVFDFTATGAAWNDFKYRDQIRDSSASAHRNISEGFGRFRPREFARFLEFARASLMETESSLIDGRDRQYITAAQSSRMINLCQAALRTTTSLMLQKRRQGGLRTSDSSPSRTKPSTKRQHPQRSGSTL